MTKSDFNSGEFVETPLGVFTINGNWFYTNSDEIERYAPGLLAKTSLEDLIRTAETWVKSTDAVTILLFMLLLLLMPGYQAAIIAVIFLFIWHMTKSALVGNLATKVVRAISYEPLVILASVASISYMGISEAYSDVGYGLLFFIIFRFGWVRKMFDTFYEKYSSRISLNDRVLKMVVLRAAMEHSVPIKEVDQMEKTIKDLMKKRKGVRKR